MLADGEQNGKQECITMKVRTDATTDRGGVRHERETTCTGCQALGGGHHMQQRRNMNGADGICTWGIE